MFLALILSLFQAMQIESPYVAREDYGQTTKVVLKNGLTVIVREQYALPLTSVTTYVKAGYFDEDDRISGVSHVIEHMFFKGTARRGVGVIARETQGLGGYLNAFTYYDRTVYHSVVPAENTKKALDIQADALWNSVYDADELKREIEVVIQENNRKLDNPSAVTSEKLFSVAFEQHRMKRWRIGTPEGLRALTRDDIVAYVGKYYRPSNIILSIAGQIDREAIIEEVVKLYGGAEDQPVEREASSSEPAQAGVRYGFERGPIEQNHVAIGFHVPGVLHNDARPLEVLAAILSEGRASILNQYVRDEKGLITSTAATFHGFADLGFFEIDFETNQPLEAQIAVLAELENIKRWGVTSESLNRAKTLIAQNYYHTLETVDGIAGNAAYFEALGDWKKSLQYLTAIEKVTAADVVRVAKTYFTNDNLGAYEYFPASRTPTLSAETYREAVLSKVPAATEQRSVQELPVSAEIPAIDEALTHDLVLPIQKRSILRGPEVYIREDHRLPLVSFGIFFPGGRLYESPRTAGITELMLRTALRGTQRFNSSDIARRLENAGARIHVVNEPDFFGYILDGVSGRMDAALEVLIEVLQQPTFREDEMEREKVLQTARIQNLKENNFAYPIQLFMHTLFGEHAYARPNVGSEESLKSITRDELEKWFKTNQRPLVPLILIVGDTQGTGLVASIADPLTNEDLHERDILSLPSPDPKRENKETVEEVGRQQTALVYGFPGANRSGADRYPLVVLRNIVSGLGGRFFDAIREKQGLAYTVHTGNAFLTKGGAIYTYTAFSPENESKVKESLEAEIGRLRKEGVTREEVEKAIAYSIGEHEIALQTRLGLVLEYARSIYSGAGVQAVTNYSALIRKVTPEQVKSIAGLYLDPASLRIAVVRGIRR
ncbi:MAG: insulinase family protein [Acidobacteria bacterium]|nr:insulinase family protein [Acidobacteriota bacterium]